MNQNELKAVLTAAGWRVDRDPMHHEMNECDWYAWKPVRPTGWPDCDCNDKPPSMIMRPSLFVLPGGRRADDVSIAVTGEKAGRWFELKMYSIKTDEALAAAEEALLALGAAWSAISATASKEPAP